MNYIYDIFLNFNSALYEIFEWNPNDNISHIKKIPLYKVSKQTMVDIMNNNIKFENEFLNKIFNKTETYNHQLKYSCLFVCNDVVIGYNNNLLSKLLFEDELEIIKYSKTISEININYSILSNKKLLSRHEIEVKTKLKKIIKQLLNKKEYDKLVYIYFECFNKYKDKDYIINNILNDINNDWEIVNTTLIQYNFIR